jgi:outer membrane protein
VIGYYWDLVSYNEDVKVKQQALALSEKLYNDNKKQVEIGTLAPIEIVRAEAEVAARQQDLLVSQTNVLQQETILKSYISKTGTASPALAEARIIATDQIRIPETEAIEPMQDLVARAIRNRPELEQNQIQLDNSQINVKATRNAMLPSVDAFAILRNNALAGQINTITPPAGVPSSILGRGSNIDPYFLGGYGTVLGQLFGRNFPDYSVGLQLNVPLRNRAAQADMMTAQLNLRQLQLQQQQTVNGVRVDVQNTLIAVQQARARHQAAVKNRVLQEQTLDAEQKKYSLGASTIFNVIFAQRDLATAQGNEVVAMSAYIHARTDFDRALGVTLETNHVEVREAFKGAIGRPPSALPVVEQTPPAAQK